MMIASRGEMTVSGSVLDIISYLGKLCSQISGSFTWYQGYTCKSCVEAINTPNSSRYKESQYSKISRKVFLSEYLHKMIFYI